MTRPLRILYGACGEGLGHATRSGVTAAHLLERGHEVKVVSSGHAYGYLAERLPDVEQIWGLTFALVDGQVDTWRTVTQNLRGSFTGLPADWRRSSEIVRAFQPELVITDFDGFAYALAKLHRLPVLSLGNIQMVSRCRHDGEILAGAHSAYAQARTFVRAKVPRASRYLILTFFHPPVRGARTELVEPVLRAEVIGAEPERGEHLVAYGRMAQESIEALAATGAQCRIYGAREGLESDVVEGTLTFRPFSNDGFVEDLRTCRGVVASAGFSLMSEAVYLRKPMLAIPLAGQFEQIMNARYLERLGYGVAADRIDEPALERFLEREERHTEALAGYAQDGNDATLATVDRAVGELVPSRA
jgi:uncharacterized protein (TIGR00661 family)